MQTSEPVEAQRVNEVQAKMNDVIATIASEPNNQSQPYIDGVKIATLWYDFVHEHYSRRLSKVILDTLESSAIQAIANGAMQQPSQEEDQEKEVTKWQFSSELQS